jgi:GntR family transcriptional regulator
MITFRLDSTSGVPIYRQIQDQIRFGVASGLLSPGEQLPTVRSLAVELSVNPNTVIKAYSELEREGLLDSQQGSGTFVADVPAVRLSEAQRNSKLAELCTEFLSQAARYGFSPADVLKGIAALNTRGKNHERRR